MARRWGWLRSPDGLQTLLIAGYAGFVGGFLIDEALLGAALGVVKTHTILGQAVWVIVCAVLAGWLAARRRQWARIMSRERPER